MRLRLRELLAERGMEQKELAEMTGLSSRAVSEMCSGKTKRIPVEAIEKIAEVLHIEDANEIVELRKRR